MSAAPAGSPPRPRGGTDPGRDRRRALLVLLVVAALLAAGMVADLLAVPAPAADPGDVAQPPATAGSWYCPAVAGEGERVVLDVAAVGEEAAQVVIDRYDRGQARADAPVTVAAGSNHRIALTGDEAMAPVAVRWSGGPTVAAWRVHGQRAAAATCETSPADRWYVTGFTTMLGSRSRLHLFNPFTADAVVRLVFSDPDGADRLLLADNVLVPAGGTTTLNLNRFKPEIADLGVVVEVLTGRVVTQGEVWVDPPGDTPGPSGRLMLPAAPQPGTSWTFPWAADSQRSESWLSVMNPGDQAAAVEVRVTDPSEDGGDIVGEISVPAGAVSRIELASVSASTTFSVSLAVVNDQPVVASRLSSVSDRGSRVVVGDLGTNEPSRRIALVGTRGSALTTNLTVYNPGPREAVVDIVVPGAPGEWAGMALPANTRRILALADLGQAGTEPLLVTADEPVVAETRAWSAGEPGQMFLTMGVGAQRWIGPRTRPTVRRDPMLSTSAVPPTPLADDRLPELDEPLPGEVDGAVEEGVEAPATEPPGRDAGDD